jgi:class 3 adenylate cyclase
VTALRRDTAGDGFLAAFDGPARAIRAAVAIRDAVHTLGLDIRTGLHTGECEQVGDKFGGIAVHTGARISALAGPGEVLVSATVRDLAGSGIVSRIAGNTNSRASAGAESTPSSIPDGPLRTLERRRLADHAATELPIFAVDGRMVAVAHRHRRRTDACPALVLDRGTWR